MPDFEDTQSDDYYGLKCESCGAHLDEDDPAVYHEPSGWYTCPECGYNNMDD